MSAVVFTLDLAKIFHLNNRNPLYLLVIFVVYLVGKAFWVQSEIGREFQHGFVSIEIIHFSVKHFFGHLNILMTSLCLHCHTASCHPFAVNKICSHYNEHPEEISR